MSVTILNMGPQHPATHGVMRLEVFLEGERVRQVEVHVGYMHRNFEKHAEHLTFEQLIPYVDRLDYVGAMVSEHLYALAVESLAGIQVPARIEMIRILVSELGRIASHLLALGTYAIDVGATTGFLWAFREREWILQILEKISGARLLYNYIWVGGVYYELPVGIEEEIRALVRSLRYHVKSLEVLLTDNLIFCRRTAHVGVLPLEVALAYGASGPVLRGSGLRWDLRKVRGYSLYNELEFEVPIGEGKMGTVGDCWDRSWVRLQEIYQSISLVEQCLTLLEKKYPRMGQDPRAACPKKIRPPEGEFYFSGESARGEMGFTFYTQAGKDIPLRVKVRSPSFSHLHLLEYLARDVLLADLVAIVGSLDVVMCEVDK
ncbi:MAG: NADH-quinone oxidoreductase subunit D [Bacteroidia bacterium]